MTAPRRANVVLVLPWGGFDYHKQGECSKKTRGDELRRGRLQTVAFFVQIEKLSANCLLLCTQPSLHKGKTCMTSTEPAAGENKRVIQQYQGGEISNPVRVHRVNFDERDAYATAVRVLVDE